MARLQKVVLIDDNETTNFLNKRLFDKLELVAEVLIFTDAAAAYQALWGDGRDTPETMAADLPELVFLDLHMPGLTGLEFLELYSQLPAAVRQRTRLAVLTTSMLPADRDRVTQYAEIEYLVKPLSREKLERLITSFFPHTRAGVS